MLGPGRLHHQTARSYCFVPPLKPSPLRGEGVTADAVTDEGSFFPRPSHRIGKGGTPRGAYPLSLSCDWDAERKTPHPSRHPP